MDSGDLESRVTALEHEVRDLAGRVRASEQDAAAARVLAGAADRDVGEFGEDLRGLRGELHAFRAEVRGEFRAVRGEFHAFRQATAGSFNALREDFVDLRTHVDRRFADTDRGFAEMRGKLDGAAAGQQQIVELLRTIVPDHGDRRPPE